MRRLRSWPVAVGIAVLVLLGVIALTARGDNGDDAAVATRASTTTTLPPLTTTTTEAPVPTTALTPATSAPATTRRLPTTAAPAAPAATPCPAPAQGSDFAGFGATEIVITNADGPHRSCVLTADTSAQQQRGLMNQDDLDGYDGMIFRFTREAERSFWMRNTRIPLSIAFFGASGTFVSWRDMDPCGDSPDCPSYSSNGAAKYALEVPKGALPVRGATPGSRLEA